jgi:hypothetical protein
MQYPTPQYAPPTPPQQRSVSPQTHAHRRALPYPKHVRSKGMPSVVAIPLPIRQRATSNLITPPRIDGPRLVVAGGVWLRGQDLNLRPSGYEPDELPGCSTPRVVGVGCGPGGGPRRGEGLEDLAATYSPAAWAAVPWALGGFTAEFGMGSGAGPPPKPPGRPAAPARPGGAGPGGRVLVRGRCVCGAGGTIRG